MAPPQYFCIFRPVQRNFSSVLPPPSYHLCRTEAWLPLRLPLALTSLAVATLASSHIFVPTTPAREAKANAQASRTPVILELFTSEGCSSCPPADTLVAGLEEQQPVPGVEIIALEEHVDYWNHLGWTDPFSSEQWTERQQVYAASHNSQSVYTPQIVVNGRTEFVGSRAQEARQTIVASMSQLQTEISLTPRSSDKYDRDQFNVSVGKLAGAAPSDTPEVWIAITEKGLHSSVSGGENAGHDLHHASIVRLLRKLGTADKSNAPSFAAQPELKLDSSWKRPNLRVIAFVQEKRSRHLVGATSATLEP